MKLKILKAITKIMLIIAFLAASFKLGMEFQKTRLNSNAKQICLSGATDGILHLLGQIKIEEVCSNY